MLMLQLKSIQLLIQCFISVAWRISDCNCVLEFFFVIWSQLADVMPSVWVLGQGNDKSWPLFVTLSINFHRESTVLLENSVPHGQNIFGAFTRLNFFPHNDKVFWKKKEQKGYRKLSTLVLVSHTAQERANTLPTKGVRAVIKKSNFCVCFPPQALRDA